MSSIETKSDFNFVDIKNWIVNLNSLKITEENGKIKNNPTLAMSARIDPIGMQFDSFAYGDSISVIDGIGSVNWNLYEGILNSASIYFDLESFSTSEKITLDISVSNPFLEAFSFKQII